MQFVGRGGRSGLTCFRQTLWEGVLTEFPWDTRVSGAVRLNAPPLFFRLPARRALLSCFAANSKNFGAIVCILQFGKGAIFGKTGKRNMNVLATTEVCENRRLGGRCGIKLFRFLVVITVVGMLTPGCGRKQAAPPETLPAQQANPTEPHSAAQTQPQNVTPSQPARTATVHQATPAKRSVPMTQPAGSTKPQPTGSNKPLPVVP